MLCLNQPPSDGGLCAWPRLLTCCLYLRLPNRWAVGGEYFCYEANSEAVGVRAVVRVVVARCNVVGMTMTLDVKYCQRAS